MEADGATKDAMEGATEADGMFEGAVVGPGEAGAVVGIGEADGETEGTRDGSGLDSMDESDKGTIEMVGFVEGFFERPTEFEGFVDGFREDAWLAKVSNSSYAIILVKNDS